MDFKRTCNPFTFLTVIIFFLASCSEQEKSNTENTYYIDLVNFNYDSLKQNLSEKIIGKVSFYKNDKLEILSQNFITEEYPKMHFYKSATELVKEIKPETKKIRIEFGGVFTRDSISYSLQKFVYRDKQWKKTSDMGFIKGFNTSLKNNQFIIDEFGRQILINTVEYTYN